VLLPDWDKDDTSRTSSTTASKAAPHIGLTFFMRRFLRMGRLFYFGTLCIRRDTLSQSDAQGADFHL
jgi:hypothetical protein